MYFKKISKFVIKICAVLFISTVLIYFGIALLVYLNLEALSNSAKLKIFENSPKLNPAQNTQSLSPLYRFQITDAKSNVIINNPEFKKTSSYIVELIDQVDKIDSIKNNQNFTPMCELICSPSKFNIDKSSIKEPTEQFLDFFEREQNRAFDDFYFRLKLERVTAISIMFPDYIRKLVVDLENLDQMSETQKIWLSLNAEYNLARFAEHLNRANSVNLKKKNRLLDELEKLSDSCVSNNIEAIKSACYKL